MNNPVDTGTTQTVSSYRWVILTLAALSFLFTFVTRFSWPPLIPVMRPLFHLSAAQAGSFMSAFYFGYIITQVPAGVLADRLGPRGILAGSLIVPGIAMLMMRYMTSYSSGFWMRFVIGLFAGADIAAASRALTEWFPTKQRVIAWGVLMAAPSMGLLLSNFFVPAVNRAFGWKAVFEIIGIVSIIVGILALLFVRTSTMAEKSSGNPLGGLKVVFTSETLLTLSLTAFLPDVGGIGPRDVGECLFQAARLHGRRLECNHSGLWMRSRAGSVNFRFLGQIFWENAQADHCRVLLPGPSDAHFWPNPAI